MNTKSMVKINYRADRRLNAVQISTGSTNFLADLTSFIRITGLRYVTEPDQRIGIVFMSTSDFIMLRKCIYIAPNLELDDKKVQKALKRKEIGQV